MKLCLIIQVLQCVVLMCLAKDCNPADVRSLRPCGKPEGNTKNMEFVLAGDYCYAESKQVWRETENWEAARQKCQRQGGDLAKFYLQKDWNDIKTKNRNGEVFKTSDTYWIGGRLARKGGWWWGDADREGNAERIGRDGSKVPWDGGKMPTNRELNCLRIQHNLWYAASCNDKQNFLCQKPGLSAYNSKTLIHVNRGKKDGGVHFDIRDIAMISCSAPSEKGLNVTIVTKAAGSFSFTSKPGRTPIEQTLGIDIQRIKGYKHIDTRCFVFYNMTVKMNLMPALNDSVITCSNIDSKFSSSSSSLKVFVHQGLSDVTEVPRVTKHDVGFSAKLEVTNQAGNEVLDANAVSQCETILATCTGLGVEKRDVSFSIRQGDTLKVWSFGSPRKFTDHAEVLEIREFVDPVYGQSFKIETTWTVLTDLKEAKLECHAKSEGNTVTDSRTLILQPAVGALPPKLTSNRHDGKYLRKHVTLECTSLLGPITTQSWKIIDENGLVNIILVQRDRTITGITFRWLKVKVLDATSDECGHTIKTQAVMLKRGLNKLGVTFTCYSYDITIRSNRPVTSRFTRRELSATYSIFGGGAKKKRGKKVHLEVWLSNLVWYAVLFVVLSIALVELVQVFSRKKKASRLKKKTLVGAKLSVFTVHEIPRALPSNRGHELPEVLRPQQASNVARSGTDSESLPSTYTKASKKSHVKAYSESAAF